MSSPNLSVALAMYALPAVRAPYERLWAAVAERLPDLPAELSWPDEVRSAWTDDSVVVKQTCGWPLVTQLRESVAVAGAFEHDVPNADRHRYRSAMIATRPGVAQDFATAQVAYNATDSLSGWISLMAWTARPGGYLRRNGIETGSHETSLAMLQAGQAELASIDAVTLAHVRRHRPELVTGLHEVGRGPLVPSLPIVTPAGTDLVERLRDALASVVRDASLAATRRELLISGFVPLDLEDYQRDLRQLDLSQ